MSSALNHHLCFEQVTNHQKMLNFMPPKCSPFMKLLLVLTKKWTSLFLNKKTMGLDKLQFDWNVKVQILCSSLLISMYIAPTPLKICSTTTLKLAKTQKKISNFEKPIYEAGG
jgi:hypothetical protein